MSALRFVWTMTRLALIPALFCTGAATAQESVQFTGSQDWRVSQADPAVPGGLQVSTTDRSVARWRKSSHSTGQGGDCVEVAAITPAIGFRDSKDPDGPRLMVGAETARTIVDAIKAGRHDL